MRPQTTVPRDVRAAKYTALIGGEIGAMIGEWKLAAQTGMPHWAAWTLPLLLSCYAYVAFRRGRTSDVAIALGLVATSQGVAHLISAAVVDVNWQIIVAVWSLLLPVALWRLHKVTQPAPEEVDEPEATEQPTPQPAQPTQRRWKLVDAVAEVHRLEQRHPQWSDIKIGAQMGVSRVRVGQIRKAAIDKNMVPVGADWAQIVASV